MGITNMVIRGKSRDIRGNKIADVLVPGDLNENWYYCDGYTCLLYCASPALKSLPTKESGVFLMSSRAYGVHHANQSF